MEEWEICRDDIRIASTMWKNGRFVGRIKELQLQCGRLEDLWGGCQTCGRFAGRYGRVWRVWKKWDEI